METSPASAKRALTIWADAPWVDWPLKNTFDRSACAGESNEALEMLPKWTSNPLEIFAYGRAFAECILLMTYAILRFAEVQRIRPLEVNDDCVPGTLLTTKVKKQHGQRWARARPRMGITKRTDWAQPLLGLRAAYVEVNGAPMRYTSPRLELAWALLAEWPAPHCGKRRRLAVLCVSLGTWKVSRTPFTRRRTFPRRMRAR